METEVFKDIPGFEGLYKVSDNGKVKSLGNDKKRKEKILLQGISKYGYNYVTLSRDGKEKIYKIHRLVALAFIDNIENKGDVNHINGIKTDNRLENLEWATRKENIRHSYDVLCRKGSNYGKFGGESSHRTTVSRYLLDGTYLNTFQSIMEAERTLGISYKSISKTCQNKQKSAGGFIWKYA